MSLVIGCWHLPPEQLVLPARELHLWRYRLDLPEQQVEVLYSYLSGDERQRAERLLIAEKKRQFIVGRGQLRTILARYLNSTPDSLLFDYGPQGKPGLPTGNSIQFNLAHSGSWAILGIAKSAVVGVDLEKIDPLVAYSMLAERYFSEEERVTLFQTTDCRKRRTFYRLWTAKETRLKELGAGFSLANPVLSEPGFSRFLPVARHYLAAVSCSEIITSIKKYRLADTR